MKLAIKDSARDAKMIKKVGGVGCNKNNNSVNKVWYDAECKNLKLKLDLKLVNCKISNFSGTFGADYLELNKKYVNLIKKRKACIWRN